MKGRLIIKDGETVQGESFGAEESRAGELVFSTGMGGYPEGLTDPSFKGQIVVMTYPIIGNYGVPDKNFFESSKIHITGLIVNQYIDTPSHFQSKMTLGKWLKKEGVPGLVVEDTRYLAQFLRDNGSQLAKITFNKDIGYEDPNTDNLVAAVSTKTVEIIGKGAKTVVLLDCGVKDNIKRCLLLRNIRLIIAPWDFDIFSLGRKFDGVVVSNGPGNPKMVGKTIDTVRKILIKRIPLLGICLGNQILALAAGGDTYKLKYGHRGQNQPCIDLKTNRCYITTQNHGFAIGKIPRRFEPWFINANDKTNEGIIHKSLPFMSVQFHPEASPGPVDTGWIFDKFLSYL